MQVFKIATNIANESQLKINRVLRIFNFGTFVAPIYTSYLEGNIFVYTPSQDRNGEKLFNFINNKENMC